MELPDIANLLSLEGRAAVVTGASQGIGAAVAERLAGAGAKVVVHYRGDEAGAAGVVERIASRGGEARSLSAELTDAGEADRLASQAVDAFGSLDVLVNNAGIFPPAPLLDLSHDDWTAMLRANVDTAFLCLQAAARRMRKQGRGAIVNIASINASSPGPEHSHYNSSKAALVMLTRSAAQELGPYGIRVNAVSPGVVSRPGIRDQWPEGVERWERKVPLGRLVEPGDVADACLFLASDAARFISGQDLGVDGGMSATSLF